MRTVFHSCRKTSLCNFSCIQLIGRLLAMIVHKPTCLFRIAAVSKPPMPPVCHVIDIRLRFWKKYIVIPSPVIFLAWLVLFSDTRQKIIRIFRSLWCCAHVMHSLRYRKYARLIHLCVNPNVDVMCHVVLSTRVANLRVLRASFCPSST